MKNWHETFISPTKLYQIRTHGVFFHPASIGDIPRAPRTPQNHQNPIYYKDFGPEGGAKTLPRTRNFGIAVTLRWNQNLLVFPGGKNKVLIYDPWLRVAPPYVWYGGPVGCQPPPLVSLHLVVLRNQGGIRQHDQRLHFLCISFVF